MRNTKKADVFNLVAQLKKILDDKPTAEQMYREVQMMKFKIRPVYGDLSLLNFKNYRLMETLWGLGKIEEFFNKKIKTVSRKEQNTFFHLVTQFRHQLELDLNNIGFAKPVNTPQLIEMEIFKESNKKKN